jgi:hypothetical protein
MKVSTENDNNYGYEKITIVVENIPLKKLWKLFFLDLLIVILCKLLTLTVLRGFF